MAMSDNALYLFNEALLLGRDPVDELVYKKIGIEKNSEFEKVYISCKKVNENERNGEKIELNATYITSDGKKGKIKINSSKIKVAGCEEQPYEYSCIVFHNDNQIFSFCEKAR